MITSEASAYRSDFLLFYAPGAHHSDEDLTSFNDDFLKGYQRYSNVEIFIMGDSNARLGKIAHDVNIHGSRKVYYKQEYATFLRFYLSLGLLLLIVSFQKKHRHTNYQVGGSQ